MTNERSKGAAQNPVWRLLAEFSLPDESGGEDRTIELVIQAVHDLTVPPAHLEDLLAILADATRNAIRRSRSFQPGSAVVIRVFVLSDTLEDSAQGATADEPGEQIAQHSAQEAGEIGPHPVRGWGYFLIDRMIDSPGYLGNGLRRAIELYLYPEGGERGARPTGSPLSR